MPPLPRVPICSWHKDQGKDSIAKIGRREFEKRFKLLLWDEAKRLRQVFETRQMGTGSGLLGAAGGSI